MKNSKMYYIVLFFFFCTTLYFDGCRQNSSEPQVNSFVNPYAYVGEIHNETLKHIMNEVNISDLHNVNNKTSLKTEELKAKLKESVNQFSKNYKANVNIDYLFNEKGALLNKVIEIPDCQRYYMTKIDDLLSREVDEQILLTEINKIEKEANENLGEQDKAAVLSYSAVGFSSHSYWKENIILISNELPNNSRLNKTTLTALEFLWNIVKADLIGLGGYLYRVGFWGAVLSWEAAGVAAGAASSLYVISYFLDLYIDYFAGLYDNK